MKKFNYLLFVFLSALFTVLLTCSVQEKASIQKLTDSYVNSEEFRRHELTEEIVLQLQSVSSEKRGEMAGLYILQKQLDTNPFKNSKYWKQYCHFCDAIWKDVVYFPVPLSTTHKNYLVTYENSWMNERTYGGTRGHEGTDLIATEDIPGLYPVVSMTNGTIEHLGWLEKGGYRVGVRAPSGGYFYYAHLDSYGHIKEGMTVDAGDILGFMGDSGYGKEGTTGMFVTHLHIGIYLQNQDMEISVNPYWILKMIEEKRLFCSF